MGTLWQDIRYSLRTMRKGPSFTVVAILSLALGIGANTTIFSAVNALLIRPLPFHEPERLVMPYRTEAEEHTTTSLWSYPKFAALRDSNQVFAQVAAFAKLDFPLTDTDNPEKLPVELVSASYFPLLGIEAAQGRTFTAEEDATPGAHAVALISYELWQRRFGGSASVSGQTLSLNRVPLTIIGVMPQGFRGQSGTCEAWVPMMMAPQLTFPRRLTNAGSHWHEVVARLKPGISEPQAQAAMALVNARVQAADPRQTEPETISLVKIREAKTDPAIKRSLLILFAAVGFVLLIGCANIANLLLAKATTRRKEIAIRLALGASRRRIVRQLLTESILLALAGGVVGLLLALWGVELLTALNPMSNPAARAKYELIREFNTFRLDGRVLAFNVLLSCLAGVLFGIVPALRASRPDVNEALKDGGEAQRHAPLGESFRGLARFFGLRNALIVAEIAATLVLLIGAGLMLRSFARLQATQLGFDPEHVLTARLHLPRDYESDKVANFSAQLLERAKRLPGVEAASISISTPLSANSSAAALKIAGRTPTPGEPRATVGYHVIAPEHFTTLHIPVLRGRAFDAQDKASGPRVVVINQAAARKYWPNEDPIGQRVWLSIGWQQDEFAEVVGIVGDVKYRNVEEAAAPDVYLPYTQTPEEPPTFVLVRAAGDTGALSAALRREVTALDRNVPLSDVKTMTERGRDATARTRFGALLLGVFAALALLLASVGVYGMMAYAVLRRTREIGIRIALGAQRADVLRLVMRDGVVLTLSGLALGLAGALAATRVLRSQLYGVGPFDLFTFVVVSALLAVVALLANYIPARRATRVDPLVALRYE